ncbi:MAG: hypothetical protein CO113_02140 [Elusimicrobia bacterium CG_4_9_14_3_um_filter_62_55]|nr:MAG: hypothetical protein COR54_06820 [Elusimicrobia bacterium CG22_combo_CG10-13_8_21_14_all_63_91]PJA11803.1 MAG: hypothetical protein COX66_18880 [Elusimicrobia bacterium CG_4_10_14_0_2_um_filter_63_34]PJB26720.1 MAG: hypothetical protein CO113_02140 [Elusimicrobia bacterium CG_4_9_14_3_um_filter_62_55]
MTEAALLGAVLAGFAVFPGTATDALGGRLGGISSLRWDAKRELLVALPDRGQDDGKKAYAPRFHEFRVHETGDGGVSLELASTTLFRDAEGRPFSGLIDTDESKLDAEGLGIAPDGTLWVGDEYAPALYHFSRDGKLLDRILPPDHYLPGENSGRTNNRGFEGVCSSPDGSRLAVLLQSPLKQDGGKAGEFSRMLVYETADMKKSPKDFRVPRLDPAAVDAEPPLSRKDLAFNECEGVSNTAFLLLERDNRGLGADPGRSRMPAYKSVVWAELKKGKTVRIRSLDLLAVLKTGGLDPETLPVKFESIAWGVPARGGRTLWVAVDNDFEPEVPTYFFRLLLP